MIGCGSSLFDFSHYRLDVDSSSTQLLSTPTSLLSLDSHFGERNTKQNYCAVALSLSHLVFSLSLSRCRACCTFFVALSCLFHFLCRSFVLSRSLLFSKSSIYVCCKFSTYWGELFCLICCTFSVALSLSYFRAVALTFVCRSFSVALSLSYSRTVALSLNLLHYTTLHYTTLHYTTLHYTILYYTILYYTTLHYTTLCW